MYYYAKLNENQVCTEIISRAIPLSEDLSGYIEIPDYNESYIWRKWLGNQWSQEKYEPVVDMLKIKQQVNSILEENETLKQTVDSQQLRIQTQQAQIDELTLMLGDTILGGIE
jgi:hypothetical protein